MNFFAALTLFHTISGPIDPANLPLVQTTYVIDTASHLAIPLKEVRWQKISDTVIQNTTRKHTFGSAVIDTALFFMKLNSKKIPIQFSSLADENPLQNGSNYLYSNDTLTTRRQFKNGSQSYTTVYNYSSGKLSYSVTSSNLGPVDTTKFVYENDNIKLITSVTPAGNTSTKYTYAATDSIFSQDSSANATTSKILNLYLFKDNLLIRQNIYENNSLVGFVIYENGDIPTNTRKIKTRKLNYSNKISDVLGRTQNPRAGSTPSEVFRKLK